MTVFQFQPGTTPLLISVPHAGLALTDNLLTRLQGESLLLPDTDWRVDRLYDFATELGATLLVARYSRYVVDLNRDPADSSANGVCPTHDFAGNALYQDGQAPAAAEVARRLHDYWQPYHDQLVTALVQLRTQHGYALLLDAHSIASQIPRLFPGRLADFNLGTASGASCHPSLRAALLATMAGFAGYTHVLDGRFKGGYITRYYGKPDKHVHALQLELSQATYCHEQAPGDYDPLRAVQLRPRLREFVQALLHWGRLHYGR